MPGGGKEGEREGGREGGNRPRQSGQVLSSLISSKLLFDVSKYQYYHKTATKFYY